MKLHAAGVLWKKEQETDRIESQGQGVRGMHSILNTQIAQWGGTFQWRCEG